MRCRTTSPRPARRPASRSTARTHSACSLGPSSPPPAGLGPRPFSLGHCGLWSGIDVGGSWWDPVGGVDGDHPDAINAADGTMAIIDPEHAIFTSKGGLTVQLLRRDGEKYLPMCD